MRKGWSIKNTTPGCFQVVFRHRGKRYVRTTGAKNMQEALRLAPLVREAVLAELYRGISRPLVPEKKAERVLTIGDFVAAYRAANKRCNGSVERANIAALLRIAREINGVQGDEILATPLQTLSPRSARKWQALRQGIDSEQPDLSGRVKSNVTTNSAMSAAACILAVADQFPFPVPQEVRDFFLVPSLPVPRQGWQPWPIESYRAMAAAGDELTGELWLCHQLLRRLGLRASEVKAAHADWIVPMSGGRTGISIQDYPGQLPHSFSIKGAQARVLPIPGDILPAILHRAEAGGYILKGTRSHLLSRGKVAIKMPLVDFEHIDFLRQFCPPGIQKPGHELRKWVGAIIYSTQGAESARYFLGHSNLDVLLQHYSSYVATVDVDSLLKTI